MDGLVTVVCQVALARVHAIGRRAPSIGEVRSFAGGTPERIAEELSRCAGALESLVAWRQRGTQR